MAGASDQATWWRNIQVGDILEIFLISDTNQDSEPRKRASKGRDERTAEGWRPCTVVGMEGAGLRAKAVVAFTDLSGNKTEETIPVRDSGGHRLRQPASKTEDDTMKEDRAKSKKSKKAPTEDIDPVNSPDLKGLQKRTDTPDSNDPNTSIVGMRVKVLYDGDEWYEGVIRNPTKNAGEYCIIFEDDEETTALIPSPEGDVELILPKEELCEKVKKNLDPEGGLVYRLLHISLVKTRSLKSNQELPTPYTQLLSAATNAVVRRIRLRAASPAADRPADTPPPGQQSPASRRRRPASASSSSTSRRRGPPWASSTARSATRSCRPSAPPRTAASSSSPASGRTRAGTTRRARIPPRESPPRPPARRGRARPRRPPAAP
jgi:hypothetical protein